VSIPLAPAVRSIYENGAPEGERNNQLFKLACQFRDQGMSIEDAEVEAESWALKVGLTQREALSAVKSAYSRPGREPWVPAGKYRLQNLTILRDVPSIPPMPKSVEETPVEKFLAACFEVGENINICRSVWDGERERPDGAGETRTREEWIELFKDDGLKRWQGDAVGVYCSINPNNGKGRKAEHVTKWRHCLVEFDESTLEEQWAILKKAALPTSCIIRSGGRSLHGWVTVNAQSEPEFRERVEFIYKHLAHAKPDSANKDPGRLSRLPGAIRTQTGQVQELVECGAPTRTFLEWKEWTVYGDIPEALNWDRLLNFRDEADETTLLGKRWLCKGGSALWVGSSGLGKSVLCLQAAITWAIGRSFFGITPTGDGLRSLIIQAENDEGDVAEAVQGVIKSMDLSAKELEMVKKNVIIVRDCTSTGATFVDRARRLVEKYRPHLTWADPLLAFIGGDLSSQETASGFLRNMLNPLALSAGFAWMLIHHTPKPMRDGTSYQGHDKAYSGFGSSELTNWARAVLTLAPAGQDDEGTDVYRLEVSKRGKRSGLQQTHKTGEISVKRPSVHPFVFLRHSDHGMAWMEAGEPVKAKRGPKPAEVDWATYKKWPARYQDIIEFFGTKLDKSPKTIERYLKAALDAGELEKEGEVYSLKTNESEPF
jgi:RecA-family ATPase